MPGSNHHFHCGKEVWGLRSARRTQPAAHWASWADALKMVHERHPGVAETMVGALEANEESSSIQAVLRCARVLEDAGFERPNWADLFEGRSPGRVSDDEDPCQPRAGWQQKAGSVLEHHHHDHVVWPRLREPEQALMRSQRGPLASVALTSTPSDRSSRPDPATPSSQTSSAPPLVCSQLSVRPST